MFEYINCNKCSSPLSVDESKTIELYEMDHGTFLYDIDDFVDDHINKKLVYVCISCGEEYHLTYKEWEESLRKTLNRMAMHKRATVLLRKFQFSGVDETKGTSYCGNCIGYGGDGWCLNDIIEQCELGRKE